MRRLILAMVLAASCSGCYTISTHTESVNPVLINKPKPGGHYFVREERAHYLLAGLIPLNPTVVPDALRSYQVGDIRSVSVQMEYDVWGMAAYLVTAGLYSNRVVRIEGVTD